MKRICIYLTYDQQKIVDKYIGYMLKELKTCVDHLVVICNELEVIQGNEILTKYADEIFYRKNIGFDAGGFKDVLCKFLGWDKVLSYDELVLVNDSMFGPFKPMKDIFAEMEIKEADFWGIAEHGETDESHLGHIPRHVQSYFLVIRSKMLHCREFVSYWKNMPYLTTFDEVIERYEIRFSTFFSNLGYTYASLADTKANDSIYNYSQFAFISYELIKKRNFPFLKRQQLCLDTLFWQTQENLRKSMEYIDKNTDYDIGLIWENIIRTFNMSELQRTLHLQYIISSESKEKNKNHICIAIFVNYLKSEKLIFEYINELKSKYVIKIFSEKEECLIFYKENGFYCEKYSFLEFNKLISALYIYDFVCILHDTDITSDFQPSCIGKSYFYNVWENLIKNDGYISEIINIFKKEPWLGLLMHPKPNFASYFGEYGKGWNGKYNDILQIKEKLKLQCQISEQVPPFQVTDNLWIRGSVLKKLDSIEFCSLSYLWIYLAQDAGYYSGIVESLEYASINEVNLHHYLEQISYYFRKNYDDFNDYDDLKKKLNIGALITYCEKYSKISVYGIGEVAHKYKKWIRNINSYIVSDGQKKVADLDGIPVRYLSETNIDSDYGLVLCLNKNNQNQVIKLLQKKGIKHYFCV